MPFNLVDKVFTRAFFDSVSWTGIVKKSCKKKECFSQFFRIRKFFFTLCYSVDNNYSMAMCDEWLKNVAIRASGARMQVKGKRASRTKNRKRSSRIIALRETDEEDSDEDDQLEPSMVKTIVPADDGQDHITGSLHIDHLTSLPIIQPTYIRVFLYSYLVSIILSTKPLCLTTMPESIM